MVEKIFHANDQETGGTGGTLVLIPDKTDLSEGRDFILMNKAVHEEETTTLDAHHAQALKFIRLVINASTVIEYLLVIIR